MESGELLLALTVSYFAVMSLVGMMRQRREQLVDEHRRELEAQRLQAEAAQQQAEREAKREAKRREKQAQKAAAKKAA